MPPDRGSPYGQPYREQDGDGYGGDPYSRPYGQSADPGPEGDSYAQPQVFQAAVDALADPLSDPLPGQQQRSPGHPAGGYTAPEQQGSPWFRPHREPGATSPPGPVTPPDTRAPRPEPGGRAAPVPRPLGQMSQSPYGGAPAGSAPPPRQQEWHSGGAEPVSGRHAPRPQAPGPQAPGPQAPTHRSPGPQAPGHRSPGPQAPGPRSGPAVGPDPGGAPRPGRAADRARRDSRVSETAALPVVGGPGAEAGERASSLRSSSVPTPDVDDERNTSTVGLRRPGAEEFAGRAARRRAAQRRGKGAGARDAGPRPAAAGTRLEARRAARARREGPAIIASRFLGEVFISAGVVMLLFVAYQLWWTNVLAGQEAGGAAQDLQAQWDGGDGGEDSLDPERRADSFAPGEGFALLYIPKLDVRVPIAQGISKPKVLDKGLVGHYDEEPVKTAMPWDKRGNFALAGHRNTHGEPFRYINRLVAGDKMVVETATKFYTYEMANRLPATSPSNTNVIDPVPTQSGFNKPGRYITLTTCTPEFTSKLRLIVWGKMVEERPRSKGKPDALVG